MEKGQLHGAISKMREKQDQLMHRSNQLEESCAKLAALNEEFSTLAVDSISLLKENGIPLTLKMIAFDVSHQKWMKMMGLDAEVSITPGVNAEEQQSRKKQLQEMVG